MDSQQWDGVDRRAADTHIAVLAHKVDSLHADFSEMRSVLKELAEAITKLALVEERQTQLSSAMERAFTVLERLEQRVSVIESEMPQARQVHTWVVRGIWVLASAAVIFVGWKVGLVPQ